MDFPYLLRHPKFSEVEVISNDLLKKKKKTTDTGSAFISKCERMGLKLGSTYWILNNLPSVAPHQALVRAVMEQQGTIHTLLICFPGTYIRF